MVKERFHSGNEGGGHFDVEKQIQWYGKHVNHDVIQYSLVGHRLIPAKNVIDWAEPNDE